MRQVASRRAGFGHTGAHIAALAAMLALAFSLAAFLPAVDKAHASQLATARAGISTQYTHVALPTTKITSAENIKAGTSGGIALTWKRVDPSLIDGYEVQLSQSSAFDSKTLSHSFSVKSASGKTCSYRGVGLLDGTMYYVKVRTYAKLNSGMQYSKWSRVVGVKTHLVLPTTKITSAKALRVSSSGAASVKWKTSKSPKVRGYQIQLSTSKNFPKGASLSKKFTADSTAGMRGLFRGSGLLKDTTYYVRARVYGKAGSTSEWSAVKSFTTYA